MKTNRISADALASMFLFLFSIFLLTGCEDRIKTGTLIGGGMVFDINTLDPVARNAAAAMSSDGRTILVELGDGTKVTALCGKDQWAGLQIGQSLCIRPIEGSTYWMLEDPAREGDGQPAGRGGKLPYMSGPVAYSECFPLEPGMEWLFAVEVLDGAVPIRYRVVYWPMDKATDYWIPVIARGRLDKTDQDPSAENVEHYKITGIVSADRLPAAILGNSPPDKIVELEIIRDDILLYQNAKHVYWMQCPSTYQGKPLSVMDEIIVFDPEYYQIKEGPRPIGDGFLRRTVFLTAGVGLTINHNISGQQSQESLTFVGPVGISGDPPAVSLGFKRQIISDGSNPVIVEETTFAAGRGLVEMRQTIGGKPSMHWILKAVSKK